MVGTTKQGRKIMTTRKIGPLHIRSIERRNSSASANGNPAFTLHTDEGNYQTQTDAALGYGIENLTNSRFPIRTSSAMTYRP